MGISHGNHLAVDCFDVPNGIDARPAGVLQRPKLLDHLQAGSVRQGRAWRGPLGCGSVPSCLGGLAALLAAGSPAPVGRQADRAGWQPRAAAAVSAASAAAAAAATPHLGLELHLLVPLAPVPAARRRGLGADVHIHHQVGCRQAGFQGAAVAGAEVRDALRVR
jgi:hypothetical protein